MKKAIVLLFAILLSFCACAPKGPVETTEAIPVSVSGKELEIYFSDVGKADFILLSFDGEFMVIDAGYKSSKSKIKEVLNAHGVKKIKYAIATHNDKDHIGSMAYVIEKYFVETLYIPQLTSDSGQYNDMTEAAYLRGCAVIKAADGMSFDFGEAKFKIISPNKKLVSMKDENEASAVLRMDYGETSVLFMGDAMKTAEAVLSADHKEDIKTDVIKIGHHGTDSASTAQFLKNTGAKYAVISTGAEQPPAETTLKNIKDCGMALYRTDTDGDIIMTTDGKNINFEKEK